MASIGKRILSAFVEIPGEEKSPPATPAEPAPDYSNTGKTYIPSVENSAKFKQYFDKLFRDANLPGPDFFEFSKMTEAMSSIQDEKARYSAAFAGLNVQGLDKSKLLSTAAEYLRILHNDAANFDSTVDAALQEKVHAKQKEIAEKRNRIEQLSREIDELHRQVASLDNEIKKMKKKLKATAAAIRQSRKK